METMKKELTTDLITTGSHELPVPGAILFYRLRGNGPLLLMLSGGHGDADTTDAICEHLINHYTVVTYDRRGLSRSAIDASAGLPTIATHGDDAHLLLATLTNEPSLIFGSSIGALIGLDLATRHPEQVSVLVAHEPPAWTLLPAAERDSAIRSLEDIVDTFHREGTNAAFQKFATFAAVNNTDHEPEVVLAPPTPQIIANMNFFLENDAPGVNRYRLDIAALRASTATIVSAGGRSSGESIPHRCAEALAAERSTTVIDFPGSHTGWLLRPKKFAAKLIEVLEADSPMSKINK
jgi:pimeloyl-ACP methyl ester carboxylesterase